MVIVREVFDRARDFINRDARPLERALCEWEFGHGTTNAVLAELGGYQNADGGFGRALEPDLRTSASSVVATTIAFQVLRRLNAGADEPLVQQAMHHLLDAYLPERKAWPLVPAEVMDAPHAPWWNYVDIDDTRFLSPARLNPGAEILGYLLDYPELAPPDMIEDLWKACVRRVREAESIEMHELICLTRLAETLSLESGKRAELVGLLAPVVKDLVAQDEAAWTGYGLRPLMVVSGPNSPFYPALADAVAAEIDWSVARQCDDGSWNPSYSWEGTAGDLWPRILPEIKGIVTLKFLCQLKAFGRLPPTCVES